jgi:F-type H+-transporting ATPase subunit epsilon
MAETVAFELVSPEKLLVAEDAALVVVPGAEGNIGVLPRHVPLISTLRPGVIEVQKVRGTAEHSVFVAGGFLEVTGERCTVLAEAAVPVSQIDPAQVDQDLSDFAEDLADAKTDHERRAAEKALEVARAKKMALRASH